MKETFPKLVKEIDIQVQEAQNPNKTDIKKRIIKAAKEKQLPYSGVPIRMSAIFSKETLQAGKD